MKVNFRIDSGTRCNITVKHKLDALSLSANHKLEKSTKTLQSFTNHKLVSLGRVTLSVGRSDDNQDNIQVVFEVVDIDQECVISGETAKRLELMQRLNSIDNIDADELVRDFPELERTTGILPGEYHNKVDYDSPGVVHPVRRLSAAIREKAIKE